MAIVAAFATPHPPIIVPAVGRGEELRAAATIAAMQEVAERVAALDPELLVFITPHGDIYADAFQFSSGSEARGDFASFGDRSASWRFDLDAGFTAELGEAADGWAGDAGVAVGSSDGTRLTDAAACSAAADGDRAGTAADPTYPLPHVCLPLPKGLLDHGCMVPLYFIAQRLKKVKIARIGVSFLSAATHWQLGRCLAATCAAADARLGERRVVIIASGDLSHKNLGSHYGYSEAAPLFDARICEIFAGGQLEQLLSMDETMVRAAAECGLNPFRIMAGALASSNYKPELLSYEAPWGIGYAVAAFEMSL